MAIPIQNHKLTPEQYVKLFSNPVSGIACDIFSAVENKDIHDEIVRNLSRIRYSKSMILKALEFWYDYNNKFYSKIKKIYHPCIDLTIKLEIGLNGILTNYSMIQKYPNSYLFSHRHIQSLGSSKYNNSLKTQHKLLQNKLGINFIEFQEGTLEPYYIFHDYEKFGIEFTVFPCEHPYIEKQKISKVGITDNGNVYILHPVRKKK